MNNFHPLEVVGPGDETHFHGGEEKIFTIFINVVRVKKQHRWDFHNNSHSKVNKNKASDVINHLQKVARSFSLMLIN